VKFKNVNKPEKVRIFDDSGVCRWLTVGVGDIIDLPEEYGVMLGFEKVKEDEKPKTEDKDEPKTDNLEDKGFFDELTSIKGIGKKTAEDIIKAYATKALLIKEIKKKKDLPFRDDVVKKLIKKYK